MEALCKAYVRALAAQAGVSCAVPDPDCGIDLSLRAVVQDANRHRDVSAQLDLQLTSTTLAAIAQSDVIVNLDATKYNDMCIQGRCPRILVVLVLPLEESEWLTQTPDELILRKCTFWISLVGRERTTSVSSMRVRIPRANIFSVEVIQRLLLREMEQTQ